MMAFVCLLSLVLMGSLSISQVVDAQLHDQATLLAINKELGVPGWDVNNSDYCSWRGIGCAADELIVERLDLSHRGLRELGSLRNLRSLNLSNNLLIGEIPDELQSLEKLQEFQISGNKFNGSIPIWVGNLTNLRVFTAYENELAGKIPDNLGSHSELQLLNLHSNQLEGAIPDTIFASGKLEVLVLTQNELTGNLPELVGKCKGLSNIRIDNNNLSGEIVPEFAQCSNLTLLNLASNGFTGMIPPGLGQLTNLQELIVSGNSLFGDIPESILRCKNLNKLDLSNNRFNGTIPGDLCNTSRLQYLLNYLTGSIPPEIGHIKNLQIALNLSFNHLHGLLPLELGKLDKLVSLDLSNNQLSGNIPSALKGMLSLIEVNFSNNLFTGPVPTFVPFQKSPNSSFLGNKGLCGEPLSSSCGTNGSDHESYHHKRQEKAAKAGGVADDGINNRAVIIAGNVFVDNLRQAIDFDAVVKATLKDSNKLNSGTFSTVYKAVMPSGLILSVKNADFKPLVGEIEISKLLDPSKGTASISCSCRFIGYIPPEYAYTMQVTAPGNVYSYGVVLLEILTTRLPVDEAFGEGIDLVKWVHTAPARGENTRADTGCKA
ncbi:Leucine-rich repeat receptor-like tyrosine-protein kinase PXC3 [Vitis vinifera]|uniref:non-specific serine/threonine protein kinase n=1 Tax=Vitis vinifera TaxID=29760 RepID=A0A438JL96_VITVI|nr:Leucine-rich repeat receptor-like tyrosine-protein kinase PXC3 [Vitis vinifera]